MVSESPKVDFKINVKKNTYEAKVLEFLKETGYLLLDASLPKRYKAYSALWRKLFGLDLSKYERYQKKWKRMINSTLERLEEKGLIKKTKESKNSCWLLNDRGEVVVGQLMNFKIKLPEKDGRLRIFIYDISEGRRRDRNEIRIDLIGFGYKMLQKSVWIGKRPLPVSFLEEIKGKGLWRNVHLFEVKEGGTLDDLDT